ncbi:hypothetical protein NA643_15460 [Pseudomonas stutzeri]|uniref:hypothetical protein n=1 Tax=Stutzerimonas stutzeri TaxID=316 RepID=UPI000C9D0C44|nr:hypothetical protein [Stutzerimonas stutzeri]MCQ4280491.1 hypothetical protein [Stutzerimonas stutzeri]PNF71530.1 hypothetical protein CXK96_16980 [Stutzerimonas stutzeri]
MDDQPLIDLDLFLRLFNSGWIIDGRAGGLIRGRLHEEGHILMITPTGTLGGYSVCGLAEGGEFIMSTKATAVHLERLEQINADRGSSVQLADMSMVTRVLDTRAEPHDKFLIVEHQYIINRVSTDQHLNELQTLNDQFPSYSGRVLSDEEIQHLLANN